MALQPMYPGQPNSPQTELAADITADDTTIPLLNSAALPPAPNLAVIGTDETAETVLYTGIDGNNLTGVTRGFQGVAKAWNAGTKVARNFTAYDYDALRQNIEEVAGDIAAIHGDVSAIQSDVSAIRTDIGDKSQLQTSDKSNLVAAVNELFTSVGSGKEMLAAAITDKGVPTSPTDTFATMAANIEAIETGGPWFGDWGAYTPVYDISGATISVPTGTWHTFVDVDGKGFLKWCRAFSANSVPIIPKIKITVDGNELLVDANNPPNIVSRIGHEFVAELPFSNSLKIEVLNNHTSAAGIGLDYLYFLENTSPNPSTNTILDQSLVRTVVFETDSSTLTDVVNIVGSGYLHYVKFLCFGVVSSGVLSAFGDINVDGAQQMTDREVFMSTNRSFKLENVYGPIRFNSSLRIRTRKNRADSTLFALCFVRYSLD